MVGRVDGFRIEHFFDDGTYPNSRLPLLFYEEALPPAGVTPEALEEMFAANGWPPAWRASVFTYHHYHSTSHETLGVARGTARLLLGGPEGREFDVEPGDVIVIPAGVAHRRLDSSGDFLVVGCYPPGQNWDLLRGEAGERPQVDQNIARVPLPSTDPVGGLSGPLVAQWRHVGARTH
jgi:uncharacterized protein YjlB